MPSQPPQPNPSTAPSSAGARRIHGSGEMAELTRAFDWSRTPVGPIEQWPESLLTMVNTVLESRHPMFLWWGEDLIQFYNDAYRPSIREDKHPGALGQRGQECWREIWPIIGPQIDAVMQRGEASWNENQLVPILRDGVLEDVYWTYGYSPVRHASGAIAGTLVICTETTASVLAGLQLQHEARRLDELFQQAPAFFAVLSGPEHIFALTNAPYLDLIGRKNVIGKSVRDAIPEAAEQGFIDLLDGVYRTGVPHVGSNTPIHLARTGTGGPESGGIGAGGSGVDELELRYLDFVYQPHRAADGSVSGIIVLGVDVTENRRAQQVMLQSEKLNAVGRLASSIAHEINNPLAAVTNLLYLAQQVSVEPEAKQYLATAEIELRRVSAIANQTLRFHRQSHNARPVLADELIDATLPLYQGRLLNAHVTVERRERAKLPVVCLDGEIRQVLSNLVGNAIDAMSPLGGTLLIRTREGTDWETGRRGVRITVADTGMGMSSYTLSKVFDPFFTTKGKQGNGLGLWISREIVDRNRGVLHLKSSQSAAHAGTVFVLFLPGDGRPSDDDFSPAGEDES